jgi:DNA-binding NarL/FixJ family response regulator
MTVAAAARVAVFDADPVVRVSLVTALRDEGYTVQSCSSVADVEALAQRREVDAAIVVSTSRNPEPTDAERADIARLCLALPTLVTRVEVEDPLVTVRRLGGALRTQSALLRRGWSHSRDLLDRGSALLQATQERFDAATVGARARPVPSHERNLLQALQRLLGAEPADLATAMQRGADVLAEVLDADKTDIFLVDQRREYLVAVGTSDTPMGQLQHELGLNRLPVAAGGRAAEVFRTGWSFLHGQLHTDPGELPAVGTELGMRSCVIAPLVVGGERQGVLLAGSRAANYFSSRDRQFLEAVGHWISLIGNLSIQAKQLAARNGPIQTPGLVEHDVVLDTITRRQQEIAILVADGLSNAEIAARLVLAQGTVANHIAQILQRLGFRSRTQIATWAAAHGLRRPAFD